MRAWLPRRRDAEGEQLGGDVVRAKLRDPQGVVRPAEEARLQSREELDAAVDSICKHAKELGALHVAEADVGEIFLPGRSAKVRLWTCGMDGTWPRRPVDRSAGGRCMQSVRSW